MKVGDYVRTRWGCIAKFEGINEGFYEFDNIIMDESSAVREELFVDIVEKSSPNIIDLIEVGDFVKIEFFSNRYLKRLERIFEVDYVINKSICFENSHCQLNILDGKWSNQDEELKPIIKSIVTKEQFESMEYKIGE